MIKIGKENKLPSEVYGYLSARFCVFVFIFFLLYVVSNNDFVLLLFFLFIILGAVILVRSFAKFQSFKFTLSDQGLSVERGKGKEEFSFSKIEHVEIKRGILHKLFHLSSIEIWASFFPKGEKIRRESKNPDLVILVKKDSAHFMKNFIFDKKSFHNYDYKYDR